MPNMANITLKNSAGVDVTAVKLTPSAGDNVAAQWRIEDLALAPAFRPVLQLVSRWNAARDARRLEYRIVTPDARVFPAADTTTLVGKVLSTGSHVVPQVLSTEVSDDASAYLASFISSALVQESLKSGFAPT